MCLLALAAAPSVADVLVLSLPEIDWRPGEEILAFTVVLAEGSIVSAPPARAGWRIEVDNGVDGTATLTAEAHIGAAPLTLPADGDYFRGFLRIERSVADAILDPAALDIRLSGTVSLTMNDLPVRTLLLSPGDFLVRSEGPR